MFYEQRGQCGWRPVSKSEYNGETGETVRDQIGGGDKTQLDAGHILKVELIKDLFLNWIGSLRERKESVLTPKFFGLTGEWGCSQ